MPSKPYKKPPVEKLEKVLAATGGNLSEAARMLGVSRKMLRRWCNEDEEFDDALYEARMRTFDKAVSTAQAVAFGVPIMEKGKFVGWQEHPDPQMLRYFMTTLGKDEGFGEEATVHHTVATKGIDIHKWIELEMTADKMQAEESGDEQ